MRNFTTIAMLGLLALLLLFGSTFVVSESQTAIVLNLGKIVPEARGAAQRIRAESAGYRAATIAKAEGDARRFSLLVEQYRKAPEVTRKRLYLETMQEVLASNQKVLSGRNNNILYLPLNGANAPVGGAVPATQLPSVKSSAPAADEERPARATGREGSR